MAEGASPELLRELLAELEVQLREHHYEVDKLKAGLPEKEIEDRLRAIGVEADPELVTWFSWRDGSDLQTSLPSFWLFSLSHVEDLYQSADFGTEEWQWAPGWLKIAGPMYGMAVGPAVASGQPRVRAASPEHTVQGATATHQVVSLCTPVTWWIEAIHANAWEVIDDQGRSDPTRIPLERRLTGLV
jgi:hypothetical protein